MSPAILLAGGAGPSAEGGLPQAQRGREWERRRLACITSLPGGRPPISTGRGPPKEGSVPRNLDEIGQVGRGVGVEASIPRLATSRTKEICTGYQRHLLAASRRAQLVGEAR